MSELTPQGQHIVTDVAARYGLGEDLVRTLLQAVAAGGGQMAQFSHPALGGMGQWSLGGMVMIGDMFNNALKARVDAVCTELAAMMRDVPVFVSASGGGSFGEWWPEGLGRPSTSGGQNDQRYAFFPDARRLVVDDGGQVSVYDTGQHLISGVAQQQGGGRTLTFHSQFGEVRLTDLPRIGNEQPMPPPFAPAPPAAEPIAPPAAPVAPVAAAPVAEARPLRAGPAPRSALPAEHEALFAAIERLADLQARGILSAEEFAAKKTDLLSRL